MTVYNGEQYLAQAIDSIRGQSLKDFEFVIVDDGSSDRTAAILEEAQEADPRVEVISPPRLGRARALNMAWTHAKSRYIANLDADDLAHPERLERQIAFLQRHPEVGLLGTASRALDEDTGIESLVSPPLTDPELRRELVRRNPFHHSSIMIPRRVLREVGGFNEKLVVAIDYELWVRIGCRYRLANLPDVLSVKRSHRQAYFRRFIFRKRYKINASIRWRAWRQFSLPLTDIRFILHPNRLPRDFIAIKFPKCAPLCRRLALRLNKKKMSSPDWRKLT